MLTVLDSHDAISVMKLLHTDDTINLVEVYIDFSEDQHFHFILKFRVNS
jgi:hypothetical protein